MQHFTYTPFGEQKQTKGQVLDNPITHKGFTGHEEIEGMNLIHMGGRIYDPILGRFLSADPTIEAPADPQDLNRYSYCINNPLKYVDSNGYGFWGSLGRSISHAFKSARDFVCKFFDSKTVMSILQIAVGIINPWLVPIVTAAMTAAAGGDFSDILKATALVALNEVVWWGVGNITVGMKAGTWATNFVDHAESALLHGVAGGGLSCLEGSGFKDGFLAATVGDACSGSVNNLKIDGHKYLSILERVGANAVIGGTASAIGGGNFASGAKTGAFEQLFNDEQSHKSILEAVEDFAGTLDEIGNALMPVDGIGEIPKAGARILEEGVAGVRSLEEIGKAAETIPKYAKEVWGSIKGSGVAPDGYHGGRTFENREGLLPGTDSTGNTIGYREWDVHPSMPGQGRGSERIVSGSDGSAWYSPDHYKSFIPFK